MQNTIDSNTGKLVRWESYFRDKDNMIVSKFNNHYAVVSFRKQTKTRKKEISVRTYKVWKENGEVKCNCPSAEKGEICKHQIAVWMKAQNERQQAEIKKTEEIKKFIARW